MKDLLKNKTALVTGSSRGVGQQIAFGLAKIGCNVIVHGRIKDSVQSTIKILEKYDISTYSIYADLSETNGVDMLTSQISELGIDVDVLYNNAAIMTDYHQDIWSHKQQEWERTMQVNVYALYCLCGVFIPKMVENNFGRVVNLISGIENQPELAPYSASKWAVLKLTQDLAFKFKDTNVRINALDPGWLQTDMGGEQAPNIVTDVLPGALKPVLVENTGPTGVSFKALDYLNS